MNDIALYCFPGSLYSSIARLGLAEKKIRYEVRLVDIGPAMKNYEPEYMRINPRGVVPTLAHGERLVTDASRVVAYADEHFEGPSLRPTDQQELACMHEWIARSESIPCRELSYGSIKGPLKVMSRHVIMPRRLRLLRKHRQHNPELAERYDERIRDVEQWSETIQSPEAIEQLWAQVHATLDELEAQLHDHRFVAGSTYSQADVIWTPILARLRMLGVDAGFGGRPAITRYYARMQARPSFREAEIAERLPLGRMMRLVGGFVLPRLTVAAAAVVALCWGLWAVL